MTGYLPGTKIEGVLTRPEGALHTLEALFLAGGLTLSQVAQLTGLEPHVIQNWVKRGFLSPPQARRYTQRQFCRIAIINVLKDCFQLDKIIKLLTFLNGHMDDEGDDIIDDVRLYRYLVLLAAEGVPMPNGQRGQWKEKCQQVLADYQSPTPGDGARVEEGLIILLTAYAAGQLKNQAEALVRGLEERRDTHDSVVG